MPSVLPESGWATVCTHLACFWFSTATLIGFATWNSAAMMFSGIDSVCVPRAHVSASCGGRSGSGEPALDAGAHRLRPAQLRHGGQQARRNGAGHQRFPVRAS